MSDTLKEIEAGIERHSLDKDGSCCACRPAGYALWPCETLRAFQGWREAVLLADDRMHGEAKALGQRDEARAALQEAVVEGERLRASRPVKDGERLLDLVRYSRHALHEEGLITDQEYAELMQIHASPRRLEGYDEVRAKLADAEAKKRALVEALGKEVHLLDIYLARFGDNARIITQALAVAREALALAAKEGE